MSLALYGPQLSGHHVTPQREMLAALGLALRGVWFFALGAVCLLAAWRVYAQREGRALALGPGVAASGALYLHAVLRFIDAPASLHHVQPTAEVLCALCAVLFLAAQLRAASFGIEYHPASLGTDSESLFTLSGTVEGVLLKRRHAGPEGAGVPF